MPKRKNKLAIRGCYKRQELRKPIDDSDEFYHFIVDGASDAIIPVDISGKIVFWNRAAEAIFGYAAQEIIGESVNKILPTGFKTDMKEPLLVRETYFGKHFETVGIRKDGSELQLECSYSILGMKQGLFLTIIARDITERKKLQTELEKTTNWLRAILENANEGIVVTDEHGNIVFANKAFSEIVGYKEKELLGLNFATFLYGNEERKIAEEDTLRVKGKASRYTMSIYRKNGEMRIIQVSASPFWGEDGKYSGSVAVIMDITEREQMQQKLQEYSQQLEVLVEKRTRQLQEAQEQLLKSQRLAAIGELAGMVGHDLRNPLTGMVGAVYYLKTKSASKLDDKERRMLKIIEESIAYANKIVSDLQEYSKEISLELEEASVKAILKESLASVKIPDNIQVIDKTCRSHKIKVDVAKIKRVFTNIIKNAVDAMPEGGKLTVKSSKKQTCMEVTFTDTGVGIPEDVLAKIGKPLVTTKAKGMGFGLSICNRIMEAHRGKLSIKSEVGKGTTVKLTFPLTRKREKVKLLAAEAKSITPKS